MRVSGIALATTLTAITSSLHAADVLVLDDGTHGSAVATSLKTAGHVAVTIPTSDWDGITPEAEDFDVVVMLLTATTCGQLQPAADSAVNAFVTAGGGLVVTERAAIGNWYNCAGVTVHEHLPVRAPGASGNNASIWYVYDTDHPITQGVPELWNDAARYTEVVMKPGAVMLAGGPSFPLVTCSSVTGGMVTHINSDLTQTSGVFDPNTLTLMTNAVSFAADWTAPDCNGNGIGDQVEIANSQNADVNRNGILDACEPDCNGNGIPDSVDIDPVEVMEIDRAGGALDWISAEDDGWSDVTALPFPFTIAGETYTAFTMDSNGYIELLRDGEEEYGYGYGTVEELTTYGEGPRHTYLMAAYDDLDSSSNGFFGFRVMSGCAVFAWMTETYEDGGSDLLNEFQVAIFPDGRIEWNFGEASYAENGNELFTGIYLGHGSDTLIEVESGSIPADASWELLPGASSATQTPASWCSAAPCSTGTTQSTTAIQERSLFRSLSRWVARH